MTPEQIIAQVVNNGLDANTIIGWAVDPYTGGLQLRCNVDPPVTYTVIPVTVVNGTDSNNNLVEG
jgi:hypothetical protein